MNIKRTVILIIFVFSTIIINAESPELRELLYSAKSENKLVLLKVFHSNTSSLSFESSSFSDWFIEASLYTSNSSDLAVIKEYMVEAYPSIILLNSYGHLILPVKQVNNLAEVEEYIEKALKLKHESKPLAQFDLEYRNNKMNPTSLYEYIVKRTSLALDNSEMIDKYSRMVTSNELLDTKTLLLFIDKNTFNIPGLFCDFVKQYQEEIKQILKLSDERFYRLTEKSIEYNFRKICRNEDEAGLDYIVEIKANNFNGGDKEILHNEYMMRYFHNTYQPLKLIDYAHKYVNSVLEYKEQQEKTSSENNKGLFPSSFKNSAIRTMCASKLRNAAQYVVEIMSVKSILNDALSWCVRAEQLVGDDILYATYETKAYILYKLGRKDEALVNMEKAYNSIYQDNIEQKKKVGLSLVKMKRGEKIY
jgi:tetratricopeptide (TPR) repeat protein